MRILNPKDGTGPIKIREVFTKNQFFFQFSVIQNRVFIYRCFKTIIKIIENCKGGKCFKNYA